MILGCFWLRPGTGCGPYAPPRGINFMKKSGNGGPWTLLGCIMLHVGYTGGTPSCLLDRSDEHFHGFLTISVCPSDDFSTFWGRQNVIKHTSFKMLQTQMFSSNLGRASSHNIYAIMRMLPLSRFLALALYYSVEDVHVYMFIIFAFCLYAVATMKAQSWRFTVRILWMSGLSQL